MRLARHWSRARVDLDGTERRDGVAIAFGWSDESRGAAHAHALERARRLAAILSRRQGFRWREDLRRSWQYYGDGERPLREPLVREVALDGLLLGAITRNGYGAYVLNTVSAPFVDVDLPEARPEPGRLARLLGARPSPPVDVEGRVRAVAAAETRAWRLYRTAAGYRVLLTDRPRDPVSAEVRTLLERFGADPLYVRLCTVQGCFRARLSPKPWRLGLGAPQQAWFPWDDDPVRQRRFESWDAAYERVRSQASVCRLVAASGEVHPEIAPIVAIHDEWCLGSAPDLA
jgi:hypothetical protein